MLRLTRQADYGVLLLAHLARSGELLRADELAGRTGLPLPTVRKVLKLLSRAGILESRRGPRGGFALAAPAENLSLAAVVSAFEGPTGLTECSTQRGACRYEPGCPVAGPLQRLNATIQRTLARTTLSELVAPRTGTHRHEAH